MAFSWISLIVLAAGKSTRFGSNKLLSKVQNETMIEHVVKEATLSKANEVVVVVGHDADGIIKCLRSLQCRIIFNPAFEEGQSSSVVTGVRSVKEYAKAAMILPGDMAFIKVDQINKVIDRYNSTMSNIVVATHEGRMGHPILLRSELFDEILGIKEETFGLKEVVNIHKAQIELVEVKSPEVLMDVDIPEDLKSE